MAEPAEAFFYNGRFRVVRPLGEGGMGIVYEVFDRVTGRPVALKVLRAWNVEASSYFKREFRVLRDVRHPNLIRLHELFEDDDRMFFSMDLIEGRDFLGFVNPHYCPDEPGEHTLENISGTDRTTDYGASSVRRRARVWQFELESLRHALAQLIEAVEALHSHGLVHRDIKPSNTLIDEHGALRLLDFGLVTEADARSSSTRNIVGTAAYMAPEQATLAPITAAADWYAVGVLLFEALTGLLPFDGAPLRILMDKRERDAPSPRDFSPDLPEDLVTLCSTLLRRDPTARVRGEPWRHWSRPPAAAPEPQAGSPERARTVPFIGRSGELARLRAFHERVLGGQPCSVVVAGESGIGKTTLLRAFVEDVKRRDPRTVVLSGRCYERELIHYKGVDGLVESLVHYLRGLSKERLAALLPRHVSELLRQFPALASVDGLAHADRSRPISDSLTARGRGVAALRELLARLCDRRPVVAFLDDVQWIDTDGASLVHDLLREPDAPRLLLIATQTPGGAAGDTPTIRGERLELGPLDDGDSAALALEYGARLGLEGAPAESQALARECHGHPILLYEMLRHAATLGPGAGTRALSLNDALRARLDALEPDARLVLELACTAELPLALALVADTAGLALGVLHDAVEQLTRDRFLVQGTAGIQPSHDRIRSVVLAALAPPRLASHHRELARAFERLEPGQVEALATHWSRAGDTRRAAPAAAAAGQAAVLAFAFDRASSFYRLALAGTDDPVSASELGKSLGDALANGGRRLDAARAYLDAARVAVNEAAASELRRLAADELLRAGHIDEGIDVLDGVLRPLGLKSAKTPRGALVSLLYHRGKLALRGGGFVLRPRAEIAPETLHRIDAAFSAASGLSLVDPIRSVDFQTRGLLLALDAGEPERISHGLAQNAAMLAAGGERTLPRVTRLLAKAEGLLEASSAPEWRAFLMLARGAVGSQYGRFAEALRHLTEAELLLTEQCAGVPWLLTRTQNFLVWQLAYLGQLREIRARVASTLDGYGERKDLFSTMAVTLGPVHVVYLADDRVAAMRHDCEELMGRWSQRGFHFQHFAALFTRSAADLYEDEPARVLERVRANRAALEGSLLLRSQFFSVDLAYLCGRAALLLAELDPKRRASAADEVRKAVHTIEHADAAWGRGAALTLRAGLVRLDGDLRAAARVLERAEEAFLTAGMRLHAASAALVRAKLDGGTSARGADGLRAEGVRAPERFARVLVPLVVG